MSHRTMARLGLAGALGYMLAFIVQTVIQAMA